jgi:hypothetical protein
MEAEGVPFWEPGVLMVEGDLSELEKARLFRYLRAQRASERSGRASAAGERASGS